MPLFQRLHLRDPRRIGVALGMLCFALFAIGNIWFYSVAKRQQVEAMRSELIRLAQGAAILVDGEAVKKSKASPETALIEVQQITTNLRHFTSQFPTISYAYVLAKDTQGLYFIADVPGASTLTRENTEAPAKTGDRYEDIIEGMQAVFSDGVANADWKPIADQWGIFLSGYAPIRDHMGNVVALAGIDLQISDYEKRLVGLRSASLAGILLSFAGAALCGLIAARLSRRVFALEKSFRAMVDDQTELLCRFRNNGTILYANNAFRRFFNTQRNAKLTLFDLLPQAALNSQSPQPITQFLSSHFEIDDVRRWVRWTLRKLDSTDPENTFRQIVGHDITAQKNAEDSLRKNERHFRLLVQSSSDIIALIDRSGMILYVSPNIETLLGYTTDRINGRFIQDIVHAEDHPHANTLLMRACEQPGVGQAIELRLKRHDGQLSYFETIANSQLHSPETRAIILNARDVSERRRINAERERQSLILRHTQLTARIGSWAYDPNTNELYWTEEMYAIHGLSPLEFKPTLAKAIALYEPASAIAFTEAIETCLKHRTPFDLELNFTTNNGQKVFLRALGGSTQHLGNSTAIYGSLQDITERKNAEAERAALETKVRQTQKLESLGVLSGGIAHDFNNLLTGILGHASLLHSDLSSQPDLADSALQIERTAKRASDLCKQLLAYSGRGSFDITSVSLNELVRETTALIQHSISKSTHLIFDLSAEPLQISADRSQILQVVMNLAINASEALQGHEGTITLRTRSIQAANETPSSYYMAPEDFSGEYVLLEISDTGCGMSPETLARIFDPFFTTKFTGRGLGLAAVLGIVRAHNGALKVTSAIHQGTTFRILFPAAPLTETPSENEIPPTDWHSSGDILLIDDEEPVRLIVGRMLERIGFTVHFARDGIEGLDTYAELRPRLRAIVLDVTMPRMSGDAVLRKIRSEDSDTPILMVSGYSAIDLEARWSKTKHTAFLAKPFSSPSLRAALQNLLVDRDLATAGR